MQYNLKENNTCIQSIIYKNVYKYIIKLTLTDT